MAQKPAPSRLRTKLLALFQWFMSQPIRLMLLLYTIGIVWHCLHPIASILTGDFQQARRWYVDESALDPSHFQQLMQYDLIPKNTKSSSKLQQSSHIAQARRQATPNDTSYHIIRSLCDGLSHDPLIPCYRHTTSHTIGLEIAQVIPSVPASAAAEAIVLVVPPIRQPFSLLRPHHQDDTTEPQFHASLFQLLHRLRHASPWLSKTVLVVAPIVSSKSQVPKRMEANSTSLRPLLEDTVSVFLDAYLGSVKNHDERQDPNERLPMELTSSLLRTLLVVDLHVFNTSGYDNLLPTSADQDFTPPLPNELRILPQGRRGVLPNMDLVFLVRTVYDRSSLLTPQQLVPQFPHHRYTMVRLVTHIYNAQLASIWETIERYVPFPILLDFMEPWFEDMYSLLSFGRMLAIGHFPVSPANGDDAAWLGHRPRSLPSPQEYPRAQIQRLELILRGLSNVHERLHHSTRLYLLVSPDRFVKHEEYLIPNLLLILPLLVRIVHTVGWKQQQAFGWVLRPVWVLQILGIVGWTLTVTGRWAPMAYAVVYGWLLYSRDHDRRVHVQMAACIYATLVHVALAFGHVSLSAPSALVWTPLLAFFICDDGWWWSISRTSSLGL